MTLGLDEHCRAKNACEFVVRGALSQRRAQIERVIAEKTEPQTTVGSQSHPVATLAIIVGERTNYADRSGCARQRKVSRRTVSGGPRDRP